MTATIFAVIASAIIAATITVWLTIDDIDDQEPVTTATTATNIFGGALVVACLWIVCFLLATALELLGVIA